MENALRYFESQLSSQEKEWYEQWKADDAGCDLISFMDDNSNEALIWALQEVYEATLQKKYHEKFLSIFQNTFSYIEEL